jgi:hypothetical protein
LTSDGITSGDISGINFDSPGTLSSGDETIPDEHPTRWVEISGKPSDEHGDRTTIGSISEKI